MILVRSIAFTIAFWLWSFVIVVGWSPSMLISRPLVNLGYRIWSRGIIFILRWVADIRFEVRGLEHLPKSGGVLIAAKHQTMFDTFCLWPHLRDGVYVMKKELMWIPFFGWYATSSEQIVIDRGGHAAALKALVKDARDRIEDNREVVIFPEGTRQAPGAAPDYKPGIAALYRDLDMPVIPLATNSGVHWPAHGFMRYPGTIVYEFLEPIPAGLKRAEFMRTLEERIETKSNELRAL